MQCSSCDEQIPSSSSQLHEDLLGIRERLASFDLKLDRLSCKMEECLSGVQGPAGTDFKATYTLDPPPVSCGHEDSSQGPSVSERLGSFGPENLACPKPTVRISCGTASGSARFCEARPRLTRSSLHFQCKVSDGMGQRNMSVMELRLWKFFSNPESSFAAGIYNRLKPAFVLLVVLFSIIQTISPTILDSDINTGIECFIEAVFLLEISVLFSVCPYRRYFCLDCYNIIDIISAMPLALRVYKIVAGGRQEIYITIFGGFVPVVRLLKTMKHFQTSRLLANAFILAKEAIPALVFYYSVIWLFFTAIIYAVEEGSNIPSLPDAMWLTIVTMTTVGYGDVIPMTGAGRMAVGCLVICSTLYMAIPLGIIGSCFSAVWEDRDKILLFERLRTCFMDVGCSNLDVPQLFSRFDRTNRGSLDALEFIEMCASLKLTLSEDRLMMLFDFWANEEGRIETATFQKILFPRACLQELEKQALEGGRGSKARSTGKGSRLALSPEIEGSAESQSFAHPRPSI